jgi:Protein of unknown function (DUF2934)
MPLFGAITQFYRPKRAKPQLAEDSSLIKDQDRVFLFFNSLFTAKWKWPHSNQQSTYVPQGCCWVSYVFHSRLERIIEPQVIAPEEELPMTPSAIPLRTPPEAIAEREEQIRRRAYELYEQRGKVDGYELDDWLQAESEVSDITAKKKAA